MRPRAQLVALMLWIAFSVFAILARDVVPDFEPGFRAALADVTGESGSYPPLREVFAAPYALAAQVAIGLACGIALAGLPLLFVLTWRTWREMVDLAVGPLDLSLPVIVLVAAVAGIGEELLFRAALQPILGLWFANVAFTAAHVNLRRTSDTFGTPTTRALQTLVGFAVIFVIGWVLGLLFARVGLASAMAAHFATDLVVFMVYRRMYRWGRRRATSPAVS